MADRRFPFIDLPTAAERLGITRHQMLQLVEEGRIRPFSGKGQQSVFRTRDVEQLLSEMGVAATAPQNEAVASPEGGEAEAGARPRRKRDPIKLIGTRLSMDSRWAEISDQDIVVWLDALEPVQYERVRKVAQLAIERLNRVLEVLAAQEKGSGGSLKLSAPGSSGQER